MFGIGSAIKRGFKIAVNSAKSPTATVCLLIKDEGRYLPEWLAHYLTLGFDRIIIYDNGSGSETRAIENACTGADRRISIIDWPDKAGINPQISAYSHALRNCKTGWIAFFDTDEFLVLKNSPSIRDFLLTAGPSVGAVAVNWLFFGSNGEASYRPEPVTERFPRCALKGSLMFKSIVRARAASDMSHPHSASLRDGFTYVDSDMCETTLNDPARISRVTLEAAQLNHYVLRSAEEYAWKRQRGNSTLPDGHPKKFAKFDDADAFWRSHNHNDREDPCIASWTGRASCLRRKFDALAMPVQLDLQSVHAAIPEALAD
jgi:hypothetical protein